MCLEIRKVEHTIFQSPVTREWTWFSDTISDTKCLF